MRSLPSNFLVVNHEGIFRCTTSFEEVVGMDQLLARHAQHKLIVLRNIAAHPFGPVHLAVHTRNELPILILEAKHGFMRLLTQYHPVRRDGDSWISPRFFENDSSFEMECAFDFTVWSTAGFRMFFAINLFENNLAMWTTYNNQNYRVPFGNVFEDGRICMGGGLEDHLLSEFFVNKEEGLVNNFTRFIEALASSRWNNDALEPRCVGPISRLVRFNRETNVMMPPDDPTRITFMGIMANATLAELTKRIIA